MTFSELADWLIAEGCAIFYNNLRGITDFSILSGNIISIMQKPPLLGNLHKFDAIHPYAGCFKRKTFNSDLLLQLQ